MDIMVMLMLGYGIYIIYLHIKMKRTGEIPKNLISSKTNLERAKDIPGYIKYTFPLGIIFGTVVSVCSALMLARNYLPPIVPLISEVFMFVTIIVQAVIFLKASKKYLI